MSVHVFVDESQRVRYMICAAVVSPDDLRAVRRGLRGMLLPRQGRLHFVNESPQRRRVLLDAMRELPVRTRLYTSAEKEPIARQRAMEALLVDMRALGGQRLVIECRELSQDERERRLIATAVQRGAAPADLSYGHCRAREEPLLWVSDAVAWAYGAGPEWRPRAELLIDHVRDVDECRQDARKPGHSPSGEVPGFTSAG